MSGTRVALGVAGRSLKLIPRLPSTFVPSLVMPLFFVIVFPGAFGGLADLPGFPTDEMINWFVPVAAMMGASFAGVTTGMGIARDLEIRFYERFLSSPSPRWSLLAGAILAALARALIPLTLVLALGFALGADLPGGPLGVATLSLAGFGLAAVASVWSTGIALRFKTLQSAPLMQVGIFLALFLSTLQMPLELLTGWLHTVAKWNPITQVMDLARQGFVGHVTWEGTWPGLVAILGMFLVLLAFAWRGLRGVAD